jgi:hypothetical protein
MPKTTTRGFVDFDCPVIDDDVRVEIETLSPHGQGQFPIGHRQSMVGCSGNAVCARFPTTGAFKTQGPYDCPFWKGLNQQ